MSVVNKFQLDKWAIGKDAGMEVEGVEIVTGSIADQLRAHDNTLPQELESQLQVLLEQRALSRAFLEAAEKCRFAVGLPEHQGLIAATTEAHDKLVETFLRGSNEAK